MALFSVAGRRVVSPRVSAVESIQMQTASVDSIRQMPGGIQEMAAGMKGMENMGTICIPVYIGSTLLDEVVVSAQHRQNLRSGGRQACMAFIQHLIFDGTLLLLPDS